MYWAAQTADQKFGWDKLPKPVGLLVLIGLRNILRQRNLYDTSGLPMAVTPKLPRADTRDPHRADARRCLQRPSAARPWAWRAPVSAVTCPCTYGYQEAPSQDPGPEPACGQPGTADPA